MKLQSISIIGAGMAGLTAARELQSQGLRVVIFDKSRGAGGRMATRRIPDPSNPSSGMAVFDHGAQFFTARSDEFKRTVADWQSQGAAREWCRGFPDSSDMEARGDWQPDGHPRFCGASGMTSVPKLLARGLDVRLERTITLVDHQENGWHVVTSDGHIEQSDALLLTPPMPQSLALLDTGGFTLPEKERAALEAVHYAPCLSVLALLEGKGKVPAPGAIQLSGAPSHGEPLWIVSDNYQKGISPHPGSITIHAGPQWSRAHYEAPHAEIAAALLDHATPWLGAPARTFQVRPWRFAMPVQTHPAPCVVLPGARLAFAGDGFAGAKIEGAFLSGLAAARGLLAE